MKKNVIVLGIGRFGQAVAKELFNKGVYVTAVDEDYKKIEKIANYVSTAIQADITEEVAMKSLGISNYDLAIIATGTDLEASIEATLICKDSGVDKVIAKATSKSYARILEKIGADQIVFPEYDTGERLARAIANPNFIDLIEGSYDFSVIEVKAKNSWIGHSLKELDFRNKYQMNVVAFLRKGETIMDLDPNVRIRDNDILVLIGSKENSKKIESFI
ncbi:TrkA family potassium uptake protein [uncultured Anaerococcus sp.]|uniref:potassium channel family protein n=1 Tax=uncultured Anaerococcus sp. TaxID=293428 RepID=UPI002629AF0B|nr:TrkA family potassium uptake protein [uncultured Anaerococcus sp.]